MLYTACLPVGLSHTLLRCWCRCAQVGHPVNGTDIIPSWDNTLKLLSDKAVFVYPQSLGDAGTGDEAVDGQGEKYRQVRWQQCELVACFVLLASSLATSSGVTSTCLPQTQPPQFWSIPFWSCSVGICSDKTADDVGFLEKVITDMPERLALAPGKVRMKARVGGG